MTMRGRRYKEFGVFDFPLILSVFYALLVFYGTDSFVEGVKHENSV